MGTPTTTTVIRAAKSLRSLDRHGPGVAHHGHELPRDRAGPELLTHAPSCRNRASLNKGEAALALAHPLVESSLYAGLAHGERAEWHARAARLLADEDADAERVALHLLHTAPAADATTVATLRAAAAGASASGAPQSAAVLLRRALAEPPTDANVAADVRTELGLALAAHVHPDAPALLRDAAALAPLPGRRAEIALRGARALAIDGHSDQAIELARIGLADPADTPPATLARLEAELVANAWSNTSSMTEARRRAATPSGDPSPLPLWRINAAMRAMLAGRPAHDTLALLRPALERAALDHEPDSLLAAIALLVLIANDELDTARALCDAVVDAARPRGWLIALALGSHMRAKALVPAGRLREAEADARLAFDYKLAVAPMPVVLFALYPLIDALTELDELDAADTALAAAGQHGDPPPGALAAPLLLQSRAHLRLAQHRPAQAHADLLAAATRWQQLEVHHPGLACWRVDAAEALCALDDTASAGQLAHEHLKLAERVGLPGPRAAGLRALARTAALDERVDLLQRAADMAADSPRRLENTRALIDLGAALRRANRRADARRPLRHALELAEHGGMRRLAHRARHELHATGARPRRSALSGPDALAPAEHQVATLAAQGHTNREIAERLYISPRTVETHLTHAFQKLDITTRADLPAILHHGSDHDQTHDRDQRLPVP